MRISPVNFNAFNCKPPKNNVKFGTMTEKAENAARQYSKNCKPEDLETYIQAAKDFPKGFAHFYKAPDGHMYCSTKIPEDERGCMLEDDRIKTPMERRFVNVVRSFIELQNERASEPPYNWTSDVEPADECNDAPLIEEEIFV